MLWFCSHTPGIRILHRYELCDPQNYPNWYLTAWFLRNEGCFFLRRKVNLFKCMCIGLCVFFSLFSYQLLHFTVGLMMWNWIFNTIYIRQIHLMFLSVHRIASGRGFVPLFNNSSEIKKCINILATNCKQFLFRTIDPL